jgi:hypothetical protein
MGGLPRLLLLRLLGCLAAACRRRTADCGPSAPPPGGLAPSTPAPCSSAACIVLYCAAQGHWRQSHLWQPTRMVSATCPPPLTLLAGSLGIACRYRRADALNGGAALEVWASAHAGHRCSIETTHRLPLRTAGSRVRANGGRPRHVSPLIALQQV